MFTWVRGKLHHSPPDLSSAIQLSHAHHDEAFPPSRERHRRPGLRAVGSPRGRAGAPDCGADGEMICATMCHPSDRRADPASRRVQVIRQPSFMPMMAEGGKKGRSGVSVDQDGKSNIWSVEPTMKVRLSVSLLVGCEMSRGGERRHPPTTISDHGACRAISPLKPFADQRSAH